MKQTVNLYTFRESFRLAGRQSQFSYAGLEVLFDYLEQFEDDCGIEIELDPIGLCCEWTEDSIENVLREYGHEDIDDLERETTVLYIDDETIIYQNF